MNRVEFGHLPEKQFLPPVARPETKAPANSNENTDALGVGYAQFQVAKWMHELKVLDGYEGCRQYAAEVLNELAGGRNG